MVFKKYVLPVMVAVFGVGSAFAASEGPGSGGGVSTTKESQERDFDALQDYIKSKRAISIKDKGGNLTISGDIKAEYYFMHSRMGHESQRGYGSRKRYPNSYYHDAYEHWSRNKYSHTGRLLRIKHRDDKDKTIAPFGVAEPDVEANLICDYVAERTWGVMQIRMQNPMGYKVIDRKKGVDIADSKNMLYGSGESNNLELRKAYFGYNVWEQGTSRFDVELGRRRLYDVFDSRVQFGSNFDGVLLKTTRSFEGITDLSLKTAVFVVDSTVNHCGYVGELGCLNLGDSGVDLKYSLITWDRNAPNRYGKHHPLGCRFTNSQLTAAYNISPDVINTKAKIYAAGLINHAAFRNEITKHRLSNKAYYAGISAGEVLRKGDFAGDLCYQFVQAQAVPERDVSGIGRDNPRAISLYNRKSGGFANYKGWRAEGLYGLTDNLTINSHFDRIKQANRSIGGKHRSYEFYLAAIFAF